MAQPQNRNNTDVNDGRSAATMAGRNVEDYPQLTMVKVDQEHVDNTAQCTTDDIRSISSQWTLISTTVGTRNDDSHSVATSDFVQFDQPDEMTDQEAQQQENAEQQANYQNEHWNKRPYSNSLQQSKWKYNAPILQRSIVAGLCGLFFTTEDEGRSISEARNLIDRFLTKLMDGKQKHGQIGILNQMDTEARGTLFFVSPNITPDNVYSLAEQMVKFCQKEPHCRFLAKVYPIEETVGASMWEIRAALSVLIEKHVANHSEESTKPPTYAINFKARKNTEIKKQEIYDSVKALMKDKFKECSVNLTKPDLLIVVQLIRTTAFLAIIHKYDEYRKYALRKPTEGQEKGAAAEGGTSSTTQNDDENEEEKQEG